MPRKTSAETLEHFVCRQDSATLASLLIDLAADHAAVHDRLVRLQLSTQPKALAAEFRKSLTAWRRSTKYLGWSEAGAFGRELEAWLGQIEHELLPQDPAAALALAESFIEADDVFFNHADDSNGAIGDAIRAGCHLWLKAASRCESPAAQWPTRIEALVAADEYGARNELLRCANLLLGEDALRALVASYEAQVDAALANASADSKRINWPAGQASAALSLLSEALRDPDVLVLATLKRSPSPHPVQKEHFVQAFLKYDRPEGALPWLEGSWDHLESSRQRLQAEVLTAVGRTGEAASIRQRIFEATLSVSDLHDWLELLPPRAQTEAVERARVLAAEHADPVVVASLLMDLGDGAAAEAALVAAPGSIRGADYGTLVPLARALESQGLCTGATAVYRALLVAILDRAYAPAYAHGARYWARLAALAQRCTGLMPLESPEDFEARIRMQHKRKSSFWAHVSRARGMDAADSA
jgi:hypothetical protein